MRTNVAFGPVGIIDIGSNSIRLVVYGGSERVPSTLFNEKVMAGLGRTIGSDGQLHDDSIALAVEALARFRMVTRKIGVRRLRTVATAAVRDASNGGQFLGAVRKLGLKPALLSGDEEAVGAAMGVVSAIPAARGIVADLGGGSLELAGVARGAIGNVVSLPLGVLRVGEEPDSQWIEAILDKALAGNRLAEAAKGEGLYLVGGSFRALAQLEMQLTGHPLPIVHEHRLRLDQLDPMADYVAASKNKEIKEFGKIDMLRVPHLPAAIAVLRALILKLQPKRVVVSAYGLREGLLYADLSDRVKDQDPLLAGALEVGMRLGRFDDHGATLDQWMSPLFKGESRSDARLRLATCLLGDIAWNAHPDYRAERAVDLASHGNWVGVDAHGRALMGRALYAAFGGNGGFSPELASLLNKGDEQRAEGWGRAIRLAQRLSAGTESLLKGTAIHIDKKQLVLTIPAKRKALYSDAVAKRHEQLAEILGKKTKVCFA